MLRSNRLVLSLAGLIVLAPLVMPSLKTAGFAGADDQAGEVIRRNAPEYQPWFEPLWEPPSGEISSLLFALQAALGAGVLGYYAGYRRGQAASARPQAAGQEVAGRQDMAEGQAQQESAGA